MLWVFADRYGVDPQERRRTCKAASFSYELSDDGRRGFVTLYPAATVLCIGSDTGDYHCVRIFNDGRVIGTMCRSAAGEVFWHAT